jgi:hypothetical protein
LIIFCLFLKLLVFSVATIFNYSRPVLFKSMIKKYEKDTIKNDKPPPWKVEDKTLGLFSEHEALPTFIKRFQSHHKYESLGTRYQFHSPFEIPSTKDTRFMSKPWSVTDFEIDVDISELGENLLKYGVKRFEMFLKRFFIKIFKSKFSGENAI